MIALLAIIFVAEDLPGVQFDCANGSFHVFAPANREQEAYRTDHPLAQRTAAWESAPLYRAGFEGINDDLPRMLAIRWRREHNSPVTLSITDYNADAGTAAYAVSSERNPASARFDPVTFTGSCTARAIHGSAQ